jgi:glycosyltransferase involved in cell wall biosynthesis
MRIGIDARLVTYRRGMGNYAYNLIAGLARLDVDAEFVLYSDSEEAEGAVPRTGRFALRMLQPKLYPVWEQLRLAAAARADRIDVLHCPFNTGPVYLPTGSPRLVLSIHDMMFSLPNSIVPRRRTVYHELGRSYRHFVVGRAAHRARRIITDSECSRADIVGLLGIPRANVKVIPPAADPAFRALAAEEVDAAVLRRFGVKAPFVLAFGAGDPRKNTARIIEALALAGGASAEAPQLMLVGLTSGPAAEFRALAERLGVGTRVHTAGFISQEDLVQLYNAATIFAYPSLYEGFGFPVLEANACGTPVITSNRGSLSELSEGSAVVVDPLDAGALASAFRELLVDTGLRERLIRAGREKASRYSWGRVARDTFSVYVDAAST